MACDKRKKPNLPTVHKKKKSGNGKDDFEEIIISSDDELPPLVLLEDKKTSTSKESSSNVDLISSSWNNDGLDKLLVKDAKNSKTSIDLISSSWDNDGLDSLLTENTNDVSIDKTELIVLSWNIDGLDERGIRLRMLLGVFDSIRQHSPDVIMLQEVVDENFILLNQLGKDYKFTVYKVAEYYNIIMTKKDKAIVIGDMTQTIFTNSDMGRFLLIQELTINGSSFHILTTHLESCKESSNIRKSQLRQCFDAMKEYMTNSNVILSGDLNLRENEIRSVGLPAGILDAWVMCGSKTTEKFSWDLQLNDNLSFGAMKPRARYDRMYYSLLGDKSKCVDFKLVGKKRIDSIGLFPSDHFGLLVKFKL